LFLQVCVDNFIINADMFDEMGFDIILYDNEKRMDFNGSHNNGFCFDLLQPAEKNG
jgi:hypothetical protein